ncbi:MAG: RnfH family protein [Giesbergeria sp.]
MAESSAAPQRLNVAVVLCTAPSTIQEWCGCLPAGSRVADALRQSGMWQEDMPGVVGIWGKAAPLTRLLRDGDRVEIYRPLRVDPKTARRERFARQGARSAGLFARKKP